MKEVAIEDLATVFLGVFLRMNGSDIKTKWTKMNYSRRRKLVSKTLDVLFENVEYEDGSAIDRYKNSIQVKY